MLARAWPGTTVDWWLHKAETDEQMIATALDILTEERDSTE